MAMGMGDGDGVQSQSQPICSSCSSGKHKIEWQNVSPLWFFRFVFEHFVVTAVAPAPPPPPHMPRPAGRGCQSSYDFHSRFQKPENKKNTEIPIPAGL